MLPVMPTLPQLAGAVGLLDGALQNFKQKPLDRKGAANGGALHYCRKESNFERRVWKGFTHASLGLVE